MGPHKTVLTTGDVAKICHVAPRTVSKWFDAGHLRGYRIPGSKDRRIPVEQLVRFMRANGIPLDGLDAGTTRVLLVDLDESWCDAVRRAVEAKGGFQVMWASTAFDAGACVQEAKPHIVVVDVTLPDLTPAALTRFIRSRATLNGVSLIGMARGMSEPEGQALLQQGFDGYLSKPFDVASLIALIERTRGARAAAHA